MKVQAHPTASSPFTTIVTIAIVLLVLAILYPIISPVLDMLLCPPYPFGWCFTGQADGVVQLKNR